MNSWKEIYEKDIRMKYLLNLEIAFRKSHWDII